MNIRSSAALVCCLMSLFLSSHSKGEQEIGYESVYQRDPMNIIRRHDAQYKISKRSTPNIVDIRMFKEWSVPGKFYNVYVDSTMARLTIEITVQSSPPVAILEKPSGVPGPLPKVNGSASSGPKTAIFDIVFTSADYGNWTLRKLDASTWNVRIRGESPLHFTCQFLQGSLIQTPIKGDPIQGETYMTLLTVAGFNKLKDLRNVKLYLIESLSAYSTVFPIIQGNGKYQISQLKMLYKDFMIGIEGVDVFGHAFQRITVIKPIALILSVPSFLVSSVQTLYENTRMDIPFTLINKLSKEQDFDIKILDTQGLAQQPAILSAKLKPGQNYTGAFALDGGLLGVQTTVTITAKPYRGNYTGSSVVHTFTVTSNKTTTTSTSTSTSPTEITTSISLSQSMTTSTVLNSTSSVGSTNSYSSVASTARVDNTKTTGGAKSSITNQAGKSKPVTTNSGINNLPANSKVNTTAPQHEYKEKSFSKADLFGAASVSGLSAGLLIGVTALLTIGLLVRKSNKRKKVTPKSNGNKNDAILDHDVTWT